MNRYIIDVREPEEFAGGHVAGALNIPPHKLLGNPSELNEISKDAQLILYCRSGARSAAAENILRSKGYSNIINGINKEHVEKQYA